MTEQKTPKYTFEDWANQYTQYKMTQQIEGELLDNKDTRKSLEAAKTVMGLASKFIPDFAAKVNAPENEAKFLSDPSWQKGTVANLLEYQIVTSKQVYSTNPAEIINEVPGSALELMALELKPYGLAKTDQNERAAEIASEYSFLNQMLTAPMEESERMAKLTKYAIARTNDIADKAYGEDKDIKDKDIKNMKENVKYVALMGILSIGAKSYVEGIRAERHDSFYRVFADKDGKVDSAAVQSYARTCLKGHIDENPKEGFELMYKAHIIGQRQKEAKAKEK
ncbi:MAG: hypothetical protein AABX11_03320 [Nanoarchaeota archaeon]